MRNIVFIERVVWNDSSHVFGHIINWHIRKISKLKSICSNFNSSSKKYKLKLFFNIIRFEKKNLYHFNNLIFYIRNNNYLCLLIFINCY